jgi:hypothetical protein
MNEGGGTWMKEIKDGVVQHEIDILLCKAEQG